MPMQYSAGVTVVKVAVSEQVLFKKGKWTAKAVKIICDAPLRKNINTHLQYS